MFLMLAAAAAMTPAPVPGDDRTAILYTVRSTLDAMLQGEDVRARFDPKAIFPVVDARKGEAKESVRTLDQMLANNWKAATYREPLGIPTVFQDGAFAQVWVPYSFWADGKKGHCGIDNITLVRRGGEWVITQFGFTMNPLSTCDGLGAPTVPDVQSPQP